MSEEMNEDLLGTEGQQEDSLLGNEEQQQTQPDGEDLLSTEEQRKLAGRFDSVEDLEKAYKSLQAEYTRIKNPPQKYEVQSDIIEVDDDIQEVFKAAALSREHAERIVKKIEEKVRPKVEQAQTQSEELRARAMLGFSPNDSAYKDFIAGLREWATANVPEPVLDALKRSADGLVALHRMRQVEAASHSPTPTKNSGNPKPTIDEIQARIRDPKYWSDPQFREDTQKMIEAL